VGPLGSLERQVMDAVWEHAPATVRDVADRMRGDAARAYTTVMTTLDRLHKKGILLREKDGLAWRYRAAMDRATHERLVADALAAELVAHGEAGLAALVDATVDERQLARLAALIDARRTSL
jgi:predicted transcriptional regulator